MPPSSKLYFASSNKNKFNEAKNILSSFGIDLEFFKCELQEIQSNSLDEIANQKAKDAFLLCKNPVIIEDDGLFIDSLGGFPGPYSSYVFRTIGNDGILKLVQKNRNAKFISIIAYLDSKTGKLFKSSVTGKVSTKTKGDGWGYDPIFIPTGKNKTYAQLDDKNTLSHRYRALTKFSNWFQSM